MEMENTGKLEYLKVVDIDTSNPRTNSLLKQAVPHCETAGKSQAQAVERIVSVYLGQSQVAEKPYLCPLAMQRSSVQSFSW
jgi:hypothetical protein